MEAVKLQWIQRTMAAAQGMGFQIAIIDTDGVTHGELQKDKPNRRKLEFPMGTIKKHIDLFLPMSNMEIGKVYQVPGGVYGVERIQSCISSTMARIYGKDSHMSTMNREKHFVEVMRIA